MRLLLDNNLSVRLVELLTDRGFDVIHVQSLGLSAAPDVEQTPWLNCSRPTCH